MKSTTGSRRRTTTTRSRIQIPTDVILYGDVDLFVSSIRKGNTVRFAEMCALRSPPAPKTMTSFIAHRGSLETQFEGDNYSLEKLAALARSQGYNPNSNDIYLESLAEFPGDKDAFVPASDAESHIRRKLAKRGMEFNARTGEVTIRRRDTPPPKPVPLAPDLVDKNVKQMVRKDPSLARVNKRDLRAEAVKRHGPQK